MNLAKAHFKGLVNGKRTTRSAEHHARNRSSRGGLNKKKTFFCSPILFWTGKPEEEGRVGEPEDTGRAKKPGYEMEQATTSI